MPTKVATSAAKAASVKKNTSSSSMLNKLSKFAQPVKSELPKGFDKPDPDTLKSVKHIIAKDGNYGYCYAVMTLKTGESIRCNLYGCSKATDGSRLTLKGIRFPEDSSRWLDIFCKIAE